jgi:hypothetical protein
MSYGYQTRARWGDGIRRLFFGSRVALFAIQQCPRCRGTDRARQVCEGYCVEQYACDRCGTEWWS